MKNIDENWNTWNIITANEIGSYKITDLLPSNFFRQISQK